MVGHIDLTNISNCEILEDITQEFTFIIEELWYKFRLYFLKSSKVVS